MYARPRKKTEDIRALLTQEARVFLDTEPDAPPGSWRRVQIIIPQSPDIFIGIDKKPLELGLNRTYKVPAYPPGAQITLVLLPEQFLTGMVGIGFAPLTALVEYFGPPGE